MEKCGAVGQYGMDVVRQLARLWQCSTTEAVNVLVDADLVNDLSDYAHRRTPAAVTANMLDAKMVERTLA